MYKKAIFLLFFIYIFGIFLKAQNIRFNKAFPISPYSVAWSCSVQNAPDGYVLYGLAVDSNNYQGPAIAKIDSEGNILWQKSFQRIGYDFIPYADANELGIIVPWGGEIGEMDWYNDTATTSIGYWGLYRYDEIGDTIWTREYEDTADVMTDQIIITRDKKYLIYGAWANNTDHYHGFATIVLKKTDSLGNIIWTRTYYDTNSHVRLATGIDTCIDGGYILCACDYDTITNYSKLACLNASIMVMKTDSAGNPLWTKYIPNPICNAQAFSIRTLKTRGYIVCGYWDDSLNWNGNVPFEHIFMAKLNDTGNVLWNKTYGLQSEGIDNVLYNVREMPNGDLIACGYGDSLGRSRPGVILRTDSNGIQKWLRYYYKFYPNSADLLTDIQFTEDGGFISSGSTNNPAYIWVVKTDSLGCDTIGCNFTGIEQLKENVGGVKVYPNPNNGSFTISLSNMADKCTIEIYNVLGEKVMFATPQYLRDDNLIDLTGQPGGVYFYRVLKETGELVGSGKILIE